MVRVAFVNENTLGHRSYLEPLADGLRSRIEIDWFNAAPLPPDLDWFGNASIRGLRRWGLDAGATRWRMAASHHALRQVTAKHAQEPYQAIVVNTQSVGLSFPRWRGCPPLLVCLDATFQQLAKTPWFAPGTIGRLAAPLMLAWLFKREMQLFRKAHYLLPWSEAAARSLRDHYGIKSHKIRILPPSVGNPVTRHKVKPPGQKRQILFMGGDFKRKGGPVLLEAFRSHLRKDWELHIVTQSEVQEEPGLVLHRGVARGSEAWIRHWQDADLFILPSIMETFGIVLVEALSFGVPVISSRAGAAEEILDNGRMGLLLDEVTPEAILAAVRCLEENPAETQARVVHGWAWARERYSLEAHGDRLSKILEGCREANRNSGCNLGLSAS